MNPPDKPTAPTDPPSSVPPTERARITADGKCIWCLRPVEHGTRHEPNEACCPCNVVPLATERTEEGKHPVIEEAFSALATARAAASSESVEALKRDIEELLISIGRLPRGHETTAVLAEMIASRIRQAETPIPATSHSQPVKPQGEEMTPDELGAQDERARADWEEGEGAEICTASGIWHAALAYERNRVAQRVLGQGKEMRIQWREEGRGYVTTNLEEGGHRVWVQPLPEAAKGGGS